MNPHLTRMETGACGKSVLNESLEVIDEIEKFIREYESSPAMTSLILNKGKIYEKSELLDILGSDSDRHKTSSKLKPNPMPPKKRKYEDQPKKPDKRREECKRGRSAGRKINRAQQHELKWSTTKRLYHPRKYTPYYVMVHSYRRKAQTTVARAMKDSRTARNVVVKEEVVDLTDDDGFVIRLNFAKECYFQVVESFEVATARARVVVHPTLIAAPEVRVPRVLLNVDESFIDLTQEEEIVASEKELANRILPVVLDCHKIYAMHSLGGCLWSDRTDNPLISNQVAALGCALLASIADVFVKNLNLARFLEIISTKLNLHHLVRVTAKSVALYLNAMLDRHREVCTSTLSQHLLRDLDDHLAVLKVKHENAGAEVIFTEAQLGQLKDQIEQYHEIVARQEDLMTRCYVNSSVAQIIPDGFSGMSREVKVEILNTRLPLSPQDIKVDLDVVCIED